MENINTEIEILESFQKQLLTNKSVTKNMIKYIERAINSDFITSNIRIESFTDTPTSINLDNTLEAVKHKINDNLYIRETLHYSYKNYLQDIIYLRDMFNGSRRSNIMSSIIKLPECLPENIINFLTTPENLKYYDANNNLVTDPLDIPILTLLTDNNEFSEYFHGLCRNPKLSNDQNDLRYQTMMRDITMFLNEDEVRKYLIYPLFTFFSVPHETEDEFFQIVTNSMVYDVITLNTILKVYRVATDKSNISFHKYMSLLSKRLTEMSVERPTKEDMDTINNIAIMIRTYDWDECRLFNNIISYISGEIAEPYEDKKPKTNIISNLS